MSGDDNSLLSTTIYGQLIVADVPNDFVGFSGNTEIPQYAYVEIDRNCSIFGNLYIRTINGFNTDTNGSIVSLGNVNINDRIITPAITLNGEDLTSTLAAKATISNPTFTGNLIAGNITSLGDISFNGLSLTTQLATKATIIDPTFTGIPSAPTASTATNTTQIATTAFVNSYVSSLGYTTGNGYAPISNPTFTGNIISLGDISFNGLSLTTQLATKATIIDPTFTGTPLAPTAATATNTTQIATTAFVNSYVSSLGYTTGSGYAPLASPSLTGTPLAPTAATATNTTQIATTAFVKAQGYAPTASPTLTGTPLAPTAATATNTTQIATTAFVKAQGYATTLSPTLTGTPLAPTAATATNTTQIATTAFVKAQGYATTTYPTFTGIINITDTTQSISPTTGALVVSGGVGVSGNIISKSSLRAGNPLKTVSATPVYTGAGITQLFSSNTLTISSVSANYEYALTNGTPYTITAGGINSTNNTVYKAFNNDANYFVSSYTQEVETYYNIDTGITSVVGGVYYDLNGNTQLSSVSTTVDSVAVNGEWIQIQIPFSLKLTSIYLEGMNDTAYPNIKNYVIAGSNNGTTWSSISTGTLTNSTSRTIDTSSNTKYYTYYRLIIKSIYRSVVAVDYPDTKFTYSIKLKQLFFTGITDDLFSNVPFYNGKTLMIEGDAGINGNLNLSGNVNILSTAVSSLYTNGALIVAGGVGIAGNLRVNGRCIFNDLFAVYNDVYFSTNLIVNQKITVNTDLTVFGNMLFATNNTNIKWNSVQHFKIEDYFADNNRFGLALNNSTQTDAGQLRFYVSSNYTASNILFSRSLTLNTYDDLMKISNNGQVNILKNITSTNSTSGALQVAGGVGIVENLNVGGATTLNGGVNIIAKGLGSVGGTLATYTDFYTFPAVGVYMFYINRCNTNGVGITSDNAVDANTSRTLIITIGVINQVIVNVGSGSGYINVVAGSNNFKLTTTLGITAFTYTYWSNKLF